MMKLLSIALATAAITVDAGTNKTLTPTPGIVRPTPGTNPPITPFPTEPTPPNVSVTIIYLFWFVLGMAATGWLRGVEKSRCRCQPSGDVVTTVCLKEGPGTNCNNLYSLFSCY